MKSFSSYPLLLFFSGMLFISAVLSFSGIAKAESIDELQAKAEGNDIQAQLTLAQAYQNDNDANKNLKLTHYWFTKAATSGNAQAQYELGKLYEARKDINDLLQAEIWYQIASENGYPGAEEAYARILERQFNQRRARQISSIQQLDQAYDDTQSSLDAPVSQPKDNLIRTDMVVISALLLLTLVFVVLKRRRRAKKDNRVSELKACIAEQNKYINQQSRKQQAQQKQIEKMYNQLQRNQKQGQDNNFALACALLGYQPNRLPDERALKARYKKLCRVYHPDADGSEEEMKRLNAAIKLVSKYRKHPLH